MMVIGIVGLCLVALLWVLLYFFFTRRIDKFMENWEKEIKEKAEKTTRKGIQSLERVAQAMDALPESIQSLQEAAEAIKASRQAMERFAFEKGFIPRPLPEEMTTAERSQLLEYLQALQNSIESLRKFEEKGMPQIEKTERNMEKIFQLIKQITNIAIYQKFCRRAEDQAKA